MIEKTVKIYSLENPITNEVFYVGKTKADFKFRLAAHVSNRTRTSTVSTYIRNMYDKHGVKPIISLLEECTEKDSNRIEEYWVYQFNSWGFNLCNHIYNKSKLNIIADTKPTQYVLVLRFLDDSLYDKLKEIAKKQRWSVNTLINSVLEDLVIMQEPTSKEKTA